MIAIPDASVTMNPVFLAGIAVLQILLLAGIQGWIASRKEKRDAQRAIDAAEAMAKIKSAEKQEDWRRQDEVASRVQAAADKAVSTADLLVKAQQETIARTDEVARIAADASARVQAQLTDIGTIGNKVHILVNSDMTAALTAERNSLRLLILALRRIGATGATGTIRAGDGRSTDLVEIEKAEARVADLEAILADRREAQAQIDTGQSSVADVRAPSTPKPA